MRKLCNILLSFVIVLLLLPCGSAQATTINTVPVGNPGNDNDPATGFGSVAYEYQIGTYEVTAGQYTEFLNAVAATDTYELYYPTMGTDVRACQIQRSGSPGSYAYTVAADYADRPVDVTSWGDAVRFANWMHNGQPTGPQGLSTTEDGSYYLNGANTDAALMAVTRKANATWVIPSEAEWYKAAYHKNDGVTGNYWWYPTQADSFPGRDMTEATNPGNNSNHWGVPYPIDSGTYYAVKAGEFELSDSAYLTFDQGGNVFEWNETVVSMANLTRGIRGGGWGSGDNQGAGDRNEDLPLTNRLDYGFRLAYVIPEPSTLMLLATGLVGLLAYAWRKRK